MNQTYQASNASSLTAASVLAMPEQDYMNEEQSNFFKGILLKIASDLAAAEAKAREAMRHTEMAADPVDRASIEESQALDMIARDRDTRTYTEVRQALVRIEAGEYGWCEETGEAIGLARLMAQPTARFTTEVQQRREMRKRTFVA